MSDPVAWAIPALAKLAVSVFYPDETVPPAHTLSIHSARSDPVISLTGVHTRAATSRGDRTDALPALAGEPWLRMGCVVLSLRCADSGVQVPTGNGA